MPQQSPLLDDYNNSGIITPALQRALDIAKQKLGPQFQLPQSAPTATTPRFTPPGLQVPPISRTPGSAETSAPTLTAQSAPTTSASPTTPAITDPDAAQHLTERDRLIKTGSGISQVKNPIGRGLLRAADVIGSAFVPRITAGIPGTELHHNYLVRQAEGTVDKDVARAKENASTAETEQRAANEGLAAPGQRARTEVETNEANARTRSLEHPQPKSLFELWHTQHPEGTAEDWAKFQEENKNPANEFEAWARDPANKGKPVSEFMKMKADNATPKEGELPLGESVAQLNKLLEKRYQVLNPGKPLPTEFTIPANATQKDYDRIDKTLEATERAAGTKAQQDEAMALRRQAADAAAQARSEREEAQGRRIVTGMEPGTGRTVVGSVADAKAGKWTGVMDLPAAEQSQVYNARHWLPLVNGGSKVNPVSDPDKAGILPLIDALDKRGAIGVIASRWNDFLTGAGISTGNEETDRMLEALRAKMGLSNTLLMKVHVGNRGGSFMLEHFEDLANQKKLNANTLRTGVKSELDYVDRLAGIPGTGQSSESGGLPGGVTLDEINAEIERRKKK